MCAFNPTGIYNCTHANNIPKFSSQYGIHLCCRKIVVMVDDLGDEVLVSESGGRFYIVVDSLVV